jgi:hypothetical protein
LLTAQSFSFLYLDPKDQQDRLAAVGAAVEVQLLFLSAQPPLALRAPVPM